MIFPVCKTLKEDCVTQALLSQMSQPGRFPVLHGMKFSKSIANETFCLVRSP